MNQDKILSTIVLSSIGFLFFAGFFGMYIPADAEQFFGVLVVGISVFWAVCFLTNKVK